MVYRLKFLNSLVSDIVFLWLFIVIAFQLKVLQQFGCWYGFEVFHFYVFSGWNFITVWLLLLFLWVFIVVVNWFKFLNSSVAYIAFYDKSF